MSSLKGQYGFHFNRFGWSDMYCDLEGYQLLNIYIFEESENYWTLPLHQEEKTSDEWKNQRVKLDSIYALFPQNPTTWLYYVGDLNETP